MSEEYGMNRRDFLKGAAIAGAGMLPTEGEAFSITKPKPINEGPIYEKAKRVWDLSREAWYPERFPLTCYNGVIGIVNLELTGKGHYLRIVSEENTYTYCPEEESRLKLELIAVNGIDQETTKGIDKSLANLGLRRTILPIECPKQEDIKKIYKITDKDSVTQSISTIDAVLTIWNKKILDYAKEHKLPVLKLASCSVGLGSLYSVGIGKSGNVPEYFKELHPLTDLTDFSPELQKRIIGEVYLRILNKVVSPLEREIERIKSFRLEEKIAALGKEAKKKRKEVEEKELAEIREVEQQAALRLEKIEEEKKVAQIAERILGYPI